MLLDRPDTHMMAASVREKLIQAITDYVAIGT
jgi:hypothetical protein